MTFQVTPDMQAQEEIILRALMKTIRPWKMQQERPVVSCFHPTNGQTLVPGDSTSYFQATYDMKFIAKQIAFDLAIACVVKDDQA